MQRTTCSSSTCKYLCGSENVLTRWLAPAAGHMQSCGGSLAMQSLRGAGPVE